MMINFNVGYYDSYESLIKWRMLMKYKSDEDVKQLIEEMIIELVVSIIKNKKQKSQQN